VSRAAPAYLASIALALQDPVFAAHSWALRDAIEHAHATTLHLVGGSSNILPGSNLAYALPINPTSLRDSSFFLESFDVKPNLKIQTVISKAIEKRRRRLLLDETHPARAKKGTLTKSDAVHIHLRTTRSQVSRLGSMDLSLSMFRVPCVMFKAFTRYLLNLPQLIRLGNGKMDDETGCLSDICQCEHPQDEFLEPTGDHICSSCKTDAITRQRAHRFLAEGWHWAAKKAACTSELEPQLTSTLRGEFSREQTSLMFPKHPSKKANEAAEKALELQQHLQELRSTGASQTQVDETQAQINALTASMDVATASRRLDVTITNLDGSEAWVDTSLVHSTSRSYLDGAEDLVRKVATAESKERDFGEPNCTIGIPSTGVLRHVQYKTQKYAMLETVADLQVQKGIRANKPTFMAACVSHLCEFSQPVFSLIGFMAANLRAATATAMARRDGRSSVQVVGAFKHEAKNAIVACVARGFGLMLSAAGVARNGILRPGG